MNSILDPTGDSVPSALTFESTLETPRVTLKKPEKKAFTMGEP